MSSLQIKLYTHGARSTWYLQYVICCAVLNAACAQAEPPPFTKVEERASHEGAEDEGQQLRLLDLDARAL